MRGILGQSRLLRRRRSIAGAIFGLVVVATVAAALPAAGGSALGGGAPVGKDFWHATGAPAATRAGVAAQVRPSRFRAFTLDRSSLANVLAKAPAERAKAAPITISLPGPDGQFQSFTLVNSPIMEPKLAAKHPEIQTYSGRGIDDKTATIRADLSPLGFHASVRSASGDWYIDPYYKTDQGVYASYFGLDLKDSRATFVEHEGDAATAEKNALALKKDTAGKAALDVGPSVVLTTYRLALVTDPSYATYFGAANVTAAKVALMNRVDQIYEDETADRMILIGNNDLLNLNTQAQAIGPNGPCGTAGCFTASQLASCGSSTLSRNRIVVGQIIGAANYDIGHIAVGQNGGGVAGLGVVGTSNKAQGCTGIPTPVGDYYAVDYVAHEMGHEFGGNHTFAGTQSNCSGGNRNNATSVEPGSGSSIMAYAGICSTDDLQPHSDPYWSERSYTELTTQRAANLNNLNEVQTAAFNHFGGGNEVQTVTFGPSFSTTTSSFKLTYHGTDSALIGAGGLAYNTANVQTALNGIVTGGVVGSVATTGFTITFSGAPLAGTDVDPVTLTGLSCGGCYGSVDETTHGGTNDSFQLTYNGSDTPVITNGGNYTAAGIQAALAGLNEVQTVALSGYTANGNSYTLNWNGNDTIPITRGQNNTAAGIQAALQGGNEQQAVTFANFNAANAGNSYQVQIGGNLSAVLGNGGTAISNANVAAAINAISGFAGTVSVSGASNTAGPTITFAGASANTDVPAVTIVFGACSAAGTPCTATNRENVKGTPAVTGWPAGETVAIGTVADTGYTVTFTPPGDVSQLAVTNGTGGTSGSVTTTTNGTLGIFPAGGTATVSGFGGSGAPSSQGFQVTFGGNLAGIDVNMLSLKNVSSGASGWVSDTTQGGPAGNKGFFTTDFGNHAPVVTVTTPTATIPEQTPFALTGSATDSDGDTVTYMWEQNDVSTAGVGLIQQPKPNGPLFRQFGVASNPPDPLVYHAILNAVDTNPQRIFPDMAQILIDNTNAATGSCPAGGAAPVPLPIRDCFSEFLPTSAYTSNTLHMRLTGRDTHPNGGGIGFADTVLTTVPTAGPFRVTGANGGVGGQPMTITWNVANTDVAPIGTANVKISFAADGLNYATVLDASTPNDGSDTVTVPNVSTTHGRVKVEALGNVYFDVNHADITTAADTTPPTTASSTSCPSAGLNGWCLAPVTVTLTATDETGGSGVASTTYSVDGGAPQTYTAPFAISADGSHTVTFSSTDVAGNAETPHSITVKVDQNDPTSSSSIAPAEMNGWYATPTITLSGQDGSGSGIDHISYRIDGEASWHTYSGPLSGFSTGNHFVQFFATDVAGRVEGTTHLFAFKVDAVKPSVNITHPADGEVFPLDKVVKAAYKCNDNESGLGSCIGTVANGSPIDTATIGTKSFTVTGTDKAGNVTTVTNHYKVVYTFNGFFSPITNNEDSKLNLVHAGDLVKVGFGLNGDRGMSIGTFSSTTVPCPPWAPHSVPAGGAGTTAGLSFGVASGHYTYGFQSDSGWAGTCRRLDLTLNDGTAAHSATFMFFA